MSAVAIATVDPATIQSWLEKIGSRIAEIRESLHRNQSGVAEDAEMSRRTLSAIENGTYAAQLDTLIRVLLALDADPWTFFGGSEASRPKQRIDVHVLHEKLDAIADSPDFALVRDVITTYHDKWRRSR